jgi:hypothetical protein
MSKRKENQQGQEAQNEHKIADSFRKRPRQQLVQCWGHEGNHLYRDCSHKGEKMMTIHNIQEAETMDCIIKLPKTVKQHDSIMVVVYKLTKATHFIPIKTTHKETNIAEIYMKEVFEVRWSA